MNKLSEKLRSMQQVYAPNSRMASHAQFMEAIAEAEKLEQPWISVEDALPEDGQRVDLYTGAGRFVNLAFMSKAKWTGYYEGDFFVEKYTDELDFRGEPKWRDGCRVALVNVTHWMPLPQPPTTP